MINLSRFEIYKDVKGGWRFRLKSDNNKIMANGESYTRKSSCKDAVKTISYECFMMWDCSGMKEGTVVEVKE